MFKSRIVRCSCQHLQPRIEVQSFTQHNFSINLSVNLDKKLLHVVLELEKVRVKEYPVHASKAPLDEIHISLLSE